MAERRMFARKIVTSDKFIDMPPNAQALYFQLCMYADDDGFVNNTKSIIRCVGAKYDDLLDLIEAGFVHKFDSGVIVIIHWKAQNSIKNDRYKSTSCVEEKSQLILDAKTGTYKISPDIV